MTMPPTDYQAQREALQNLILDRDFERLEDQLAEFNLFDVLGVEHKELQHSALLAWLLNPRGSHGLGDYFLRKFLSDLAREATLRGTTSITPITVDGWKLDDVEVVTERHHIDVLVIAPTDEFVCLIENKIKAAEAPGQLCRYLDDVKTQYEGQPFPIFLTPDGREPEDEKAAAKYVPFGYDGVERLISQTLEARRSTLSNRVRGFLEQYQSTLGRHVMETGDSIEELAQQIYEKHQTAIDLIIKSRPAVKPTDWHIIDGAIEQYAPRLEADQHDDWAHRFYVPEFDEVSDLMRANGWTESGRLLLFEAKYTSRRLSLVIGPGPQEIRQRLYDLSQREDGIPGVRMVNASSLSRKWQTIYWILLPAKPRKPLPDYRSAKAEIEQAIENFFQNDYPQLVCAIRAEFRS